jgi:voltage-gated potassium channel
MARNATPLVALRRALHVQLDPRAWPVRGLSPLNAALVCAILVGTLAAIVETEPLVSDAYRNAFVALELGFGALFAAEYVARFWSVAEDLRAGEPAWRRRLRFALSPAALFDLFAIAVTFAPFLGINALAFRLVRLLRILRLAKLGRMSTALVLLLETVRSRRYELTVTLALALTMLVLGATALYWLEGDVQPEQFGSIPRALWWAVITLTTIGYGDAYPITAAGKVMAAIVAFAGIGLIAMPTGILASSFSEAVRKHPKP